MQTHRQEHGNSNSWNSNSLREQSCHKEMGKATPTGPSLVTSENPRSEPQVRLKKCGFRLPRDVSGNSSEVSAVTPHFHSG